MHRGTVRRNLQWVLPPWDLTLSTSSISFSVFVHTECELSVCVCMSCKICNCCATQSGKCLCGQADPSKTRDTAWTPSQML